MARELNVIPRKRLCEQLGVSSKTIKRWITNRNFPEPMKASGQEPLFDANAVISWFQSMEARND